MSDHFSLVEDPLKNFAPNLERPLPTEELPKKEDNSFNISILGDGPKNRIILLSFFAFFVGAIIIFSILINHIAPNVFLIFGLVMSVIGMIITVFRFFLNHMIMAPSTLRFTRSVVFLIEIYFAISIVLFFFQNTSAAIMVAILFLCLAAFILYECQRKYGAVAISRITFLDNDEEK